MQYKILDIQGTNLDNVLERLRIAVNISCNSGWRPQGGVSITVTSQGWYCVCQSMVKEE